MFKTLVVSGGSTKGLLVLGALHYIDHICSLENIEEYYGTSIGAMICLLIAVGYKPIDLVVIFKKTNISINSLLSKTDCQIFDYDEIIRGFQEAFEAKTGAAALTFQDFFLRYKKKLHFVTFNYTHGRPEILSATSYPDMPCVEAVRLSCALPLLFKKCIYKGDLYIDGGFVNNFPLDIAARSGVNLETVLAIKIDIVWETEEIYRDRCIIINLESSAPAFNLKMDSLEIVRLLNEGYKVARATYSPNK
jgi:predicted acylesterase/phospholipase RssA